LSKNWRSTSTFVEAGNLYFSRLKQENDEIGFGADLSDLELNGIHGGVAPVFYSDVSAAGHLKDASIGRASWEFRKLEFSNPGGPKAPKPTKAVVQEAAARDVVTVIQNLIGNVIPDPECKCNIRHFRRVNYDDIVILIRAHDFGGLIAKVLREADIPVSSLGGQNIFASEAARQWRIFLGALSRPGNAQDVRLFAQSWFGKHTLSDLVMWNHEHLMQTDTASRTLDDMQRRLVNWRSMILSQGASVLGVIVDQTGVRLSLNESSAAERHITDLSQLVEIMSATSAQTPEDLETFMESAKVKGEEIDEDDADVDVSDFSLRVSRDEPAVRVMTYHKSKGLEFPIVLVPHLAASEPNNVPVTTYRLGGSEPKSYIDITAFSKEDDDAAHIGYDSKTRLSNAENLRLGYVALTRGKLMNFVWTWESEKNQPLFYSNPQEIADLAKSSGGIIALTNAHQWSPTSLSEDLLEQGSERESQASGMKVALRRTEVKRELSRPQLRSSFTSVSEYIGRQMVEVLQEEDVEPSVEGVAASTGVSEDFVDLVSSARIGDFIHHILQYLDISPDVDDETITESVRAASVAKGFREGQLPLVDVVTIIKRSLGTTLGPLADSHQLGFFGTGRRLPEVNFDFVLPETQDLRAFVSIIRRHLDSDEVCGRWSQSLQAFKELPRGVLTGSIDAVLAVGDDESPAFLVVDYKSNRLKDASGAESYAMALMESAMREHHYFLQAIIYTVALHRYLSQRMGEGVYDYETHIRGALYLFVRGMSPLVERSGVFEMRFPEKLITDLSEFFDGRSSQ
jgi:exodeoxyribonuclease V beta subunit